MGKFYRTCRRGQRRVGERLRRCYHGQHACCNEKSMRTLQSHALTARTARRRRAPWGIFLAFALVGLTVTGRLAAAEGAAAPQPETVAIRNGSLTLHALLWRPEG